MTSFACLREGFKLIFRRGIKRYSLGPLMFSLVLYGFLGAFLLQQFSIFLDWGVEMVPGWLQFLVPVAWLLFALFGLVLVGYSFAIVTMIICSPFHGLLAEKVAVHLGYRTFDEKLTTAVAMRIVKRALQREWTKLLYNFPRMLGILLLAIVLSFVPLVNLLVPVITFLWAAWSMAIQFIDYPADNDQVDFQPMLNAMRKKRSECLWFGGITTFLLSIPVINVIAVPAAVAGATKLWLEQVDDSKNV